MKQRSGSNGGIIANWFVVLNLQIICLTTLTFLVRKLCKKNSSSIFSIIHNFRLSFRNIHNFSGISEMCPKQSCSKFVSSSSGIARRRTILSHEYQTDHRRGFKRRANTGEGTAGVLMLIGRLKSRSRVVSPLTSCQSNFRRIFAHACLRENVPLARDESKIEFGVHTLRLLACG